MERWDFSWRKRSGETFDCLSFQREKVENPDRRYAVQVRRSYGQNYMEKGLSLARDYGEEMERRFLLYEKIGETGDDEVCASCLGSVPGSLWC